MNDLMSELHKEFTYHMTQAVQFQSRINALQADHKGMATARIDACTELVMEMAAPSKVAE